MPTLAQLTQLANELYDKPISGSSSASEYANWDKEKVESMGFDTSSGYFVIWSGEEYDDRYAYGRNFASAGTYHNYGFSRRHSDTQAVCLAD